MSASVSAAYGEVGARIQRARRDMGLTQKELAQAVGVSVFTLDRIESGSVDPGSHLVAIASATGLERSPVPLAERGPADGSAGHATEVRSIGLAGRGLLLGAITLLVTIRFFTEVLPILPRAANFIDIPIFLTLVLAAAVLPRARVRQRPWYLHLGGPVVAFLALAVLSAAVNGSRSAPAPVLVFIYGFLAPLAVYASVYQLWPSGYARSFSRLIILLGLLQLVVVALIDLPRFLASDNPDVVSGTFGTNAYQLVYFLLIVAALLIGIATIAPSRLIARVTPFLLLAVFATILLAQYRALLVTTGVALVAIAIIMGQRARGFVLASAAAVGFAVVFAYLASNVPVLKLESTATTLTQNPMSYLQERARGAEPVRRLYADNPFVAVTGTGPGTFSSRAWQTFANSESRSQSNVQGAYARALTGGRYETDVSRKYVQSQLQTGTIVEGSRAVSSPYSSYLALLAEVGVFGFVVLVSVYVAALVRAARLTRAALRQRLVGDAVPALGLATTVAFLTLVQMAFLENWLEVTRVTFLAWAMLAVVSKELDTRVVSAP